MSQRRTDPIAAVHAMTAGARHLLLGDRPSDADLLASHLCASWYVGAPPLQIAGLESHPLGEWPNAPVLALLDDHLDRVEDVDAALSLTRALHAHFPEGAETIELTARIEARLAERGASAPEWSLQHDQWRLAEAHEVRVPRDNTDDYGDRIMNILAFEHPCGDRHGLALTIDAHAFSHIAAIDAFDDVSEYLEDIEEGLERLGERVHLRTSEPRGLAHCIGRSINKTYLHEFDPIRYDPESISLLALTLRRSDCVYAADGLLA